MPKQVCGAGLADNPGIECFIGSQTSSSLDEDRRRWECGKDLVNGPTYFLSVTHKLTVGCSFLRAEVVAQNLIETLETHSSCVLLLIISNLHSTPNTYDMERLFLF